MSANEIQLNPNIPAVAQRAYARYAHFAEKAQAGGTAVLDDGIARAVQLQREYVVGDMYGFGSQARVLGYRTDDARDLPDQTYDEMLTDPDVAAAYWFLVYSVLADKLTLQAKVKDDEEEDYDLAQEVKDFCEHNIQRLEVPFEETLEEMLEGMVYGNKIAEKVHAFEDWQGKQRIVLDRLKVKSRAAVSFVVDRFKNVLGILPTRDADGAMSSWSSNPDVNRIIPREKFAIFTVRRKDSDPRGRSIFRPAYNGWNFKKQVYPEYLLWLLNCAVPGMLGFTSEDATDEVKKDKDGKIVRDAATGVPVYLTPEEAMLQALSRMRNSFSAVFPFGSEVQQIEVTGEGAPFQNALEVCGEEITKAILFQVLATRDAKHQTKGSTAQQMSIVDILVWAIKGTLCSMIVNDIFKPLVKYNYGEDVAKRLTPTCSLGDTERRDWAEDAQAFASIAQYLTPTQLAAVIEQLGLPEAEEGEERIGNSKTDLPAQEFDDEGNPVPVPQPGNLPPAVKKVSRIGKFVKKIGKPTKEGNAAARIEREKKVAAKAEKEKKAA